MIMTPTRIAAVAALSASLAGAATTHPLDGLSADEYSRVTEILRGDGEANWDTLCPLIRRPKAEVLAWSEGDPVTRRALVRYTGTDGLRTAKVAITRGMVETAGSAKGDPARRGRGTRLSRRGGLRRGGVGLYINRPPGMAARFNMMIHVRNVHLEAFLRRSNVPVVSS